MVLSRSFLRGGWSLHELRGLIQREIHVGETILPILHDISLDEVREFDASLADMHALDTSRHDLDQIVTTILDFLRGKHPKGPPRPPDLLDVRTLANLARMRDEEVLKRLERYGTAARVSPGSGETAMGLGLTCLYLRRFPEAIEKLAAAVRLLPASGRAHLLHRQHERVPVHPFAHQVEGIVANRPRQERVAEGDVTPSSVYAHIDQSLGSWEQRLVFKTNVKNFVSLRKVQPPTPLADLRRIGELFPTPGFPFPLAPCFEPESDAPDPAKTEIFAVLQKYNRINLVVPVGAPHMFHAAMESKACKLTALGEHYRRLVALKRI